MPVGACVSREVEMADFVEDSHVESEDLIENDEEVKEETQKPTILDHFSTLQRSTDETERVDKTVRLLRIVHGSEDENQLKYALTRLIKGLAASRTVPKKNFYVALTQLLRITPSIEVSQVMDIVKKELNAVGSNSKSENADIHFGEILLCGSLIRSGMFVKATQEEQIHILGMLLKAGKKRHYLSLAAYNFIIEIYDQVSEKEFKSLWNHMKAELEGGDSVDFIYFILKTQQKFPKVVNSYLVEKQGSAELFRKENMREMMDKLLKTPWLVKSTHPIYSCIGNEIIAYGLEKWCALIDEYMQKSHMAMHTVVTTIMTDLLHKLEDAAQIPMFFTPNYLHFTFNCYRSAEWREDDFIKMMQKVFKIVEAKLALDTTASETKMQILHKFLHFPGDICFDSLTRSKIVHTISNSLDTDGVKSLVKLYKEILLQKEDDRHQQQQQQQAPNDDSANSGKSFFSQQDRGYAAIAMMKLLKHPSLVKEKEYKMKMIKFFLKLVFLQDDKFSNVSHSLAGVIKPHFFSILDQKFGKLEDQRDVLLNLIVHLNKKITTDPENLRVPLVEDKLEAWTEMFAFSQKLSEVCALKDENSAKLSTVFHILCLQMGFQIFRDFKLAQSSLKDIINCYDESTKQLAVKKKRSSKRKSVASTENLETEDITWIEVVVDLFLNFLSLDSHLLRNVVNCVFPHLCSHIDEKSMKQILEALFSDDENPLSAAGESDSEDEEDGNDDESDDDDEEEEEELSSEEDVEDDQLQPLRMACSKALGLDLATSDCESIDVDDLSEEEGNKLDEMLAECFKAFKPKSQRQLKAEEKKESGKIATFRSRVLDLIVIYLDTEPDLKLCFDMLPYLVHATFWSIKNDNQSLTNRLNSVLARMSKVKKTRYNADMRVEDVQAQWLELFVKNEDISATLLRTAMEEIVYAAVFVLRGAQIVENSLQSDAERQRWDAAVFDFVSRTLDTMLNDNDALVVVFLTKLFDQSYSNCAKIVQVLIEYAFNVANNWFKRCRVFKLVSLFYTNNRLLASQYETHTKIMKANWKKLSQNSLAMLTSCGADADSSKEATTTDATAGNSRYKFVELMFAVFAKLKNGPLKQHFQDMDWDAFGAAAQSVCQVDKGGVKVPQKVKYALRQLCCALKMPQQVTAACERTKQNAAAKKRQQNDQSKHLHGNGVDAQTEGDGQGTTPKRKKTRKNKTDANDTESDAPATPLTNGDVDAGLLNGDFDTEAAKTPKQKRQQKNWKGDGAVQPESTVNGLKAKKRQSVAAAQTDSSEEFADTPRKAKRKCHILTTQEGDVTNSSSQEFASPAHKKKQRKSIKSKI